MNLDFNKICRICLRYCEKYVDLNQANRVNSLSKQVAEKIKFCYLLSVDIPELPTKVCYDCIQVVSFFYIAKKNVIISEQLLKDVLYVRKKFKVGPKIRKEQNIKGSGLMKISSEKTNNCLSLLAPNDNGCSITNIQYQNCSESNTTSNLEYSKNSTVSNNPAEVLKINFKQHHNIQAKKNKKFGNFQEFGNQNELEKSCNVPNHKTISLKLMNSKRTSKQSKHLSKPFKVNTAEKGTNTHLEEPVFKEIGTVIDTNNILSPNVKRIRKSVLSS